MKNLFSTLSLLLIFSLAQSQSFNFKPEFPIPGEQLTVEFDPEDSFFQKADVVEVLVYLNDHSSEPTIMVLEKTGNTFSGTYNSPEEAKAISLYPFNRKLRLPKKPSREIARCFFYKNDRKTPIKEVYFSMYKLLQQFDRNDFISRTHPDDFLLLKKELDTNPSIKSNTDFLLLYFTAGILLKDEFVIKKAEEWLTAFFKNKNPTKDEFFVARNIAEHQDDYKTVRRILKKGADHHLDLKARLLYVKYRQVIFLHEKERIYKKIKKVEGNQPDFTNACANDLAIRYFKDGKLKKFEKFIFEIENPIKRAAAINSLVDRYVQTQLTEKEFAILKSLSGLSLKLIAQEIENHKKEAKEFVFLDRKVLLTKILASYTNSFAFLEFRSGNYQNALTLQEQVCKEMKFKNRRMNENYCRFLTAVEGTEVAEKKLEELIASGFYTYPMEEMLRMIFIAKNKTEEEYDNYINGLKFKNENFKDSLKSKELSIPAIDFTLKNFQGEEVTLKNLRGKVVVLSFWSAWGKTPTNFLLEMERIKEKFKTNTDVVLLSINTVFKDTSPILDTRRYLKLQNLELNPLLDYEQTVREMYQAPIFSNIVIDKKGIVRFKSAQFRGDRSYLNYELSNMIELAKE